MAYESHHGPGHPGYSHGKGGVNEAYFDKDTSDDSPFSHYNDSQYDKKDDPSSDYQSREEEQKNHKEEKDPLAEAVEKEEEKIKKKEEKAKKKAPEETQRSHARDKQGAPKDKKPSGDSRSIEEAITDVSKRAEKLFVLK